MKKIVLAALLALFAAVPGMAVATALQSDQAVSESPEMDPQLVEAILRAAAEECSFTYQELSTDYYAGVVTIDKVSDGYRVTDGGGAVIILMEDSF